MRIAGRADEDSEGATAEVNDARGASKFGKVSRPTDTSLTVASAMLVMSSLGARLRCAVSARMPHVDTTVRADCPVRSTETRKN